MKKVIQLLASVLVLSTSTYAQSGLSPEVGMNWSSYYGDQTEELGYKLGFKAGISYLQPITGNLYFVPGLFYTTKGYFKDQSIAGLVNETRLNVGYLELPLNVQYRFRLGDSGHEIALIGGAYVAYAVNGSLSRMVDTLGVDQSVQFGTANHEYYPFDLGLNIGLEYQLPSGLYLKAMSSSGLMNVHNKNSFSQCNQNFQLSVGFNLWHYNR